MNQHVWKRTVWCDAGVRCRGKVWQGYCARGAAFTQYISIISLIWGLVPRREGGQKEQKKMPCPQKPEEIFGGGLLVATCDFTKPPPPKCLRVPFGNPPAS